MAAQLGPPSHADTGLQPERTDLAWGRTILSVLVATAVFLRWIPHHGLFVGTLIVTAATTAVVISFTRKRRLHRAVRGINQGRIPPDVASTAAFAASAVILSLLSIYTVLFVPLNP